MPAADPSLPPAEVLSAFGIRPGGEQLRRLGDGTWRAGEIVVKRAPAPLEWLEWEERLGASIVDEGFRFQRLVPARDGRVAVDGWIARNHLAGEHRGDAWSEKLAVATTFLDALGAAAPPASAPSRPRDDPWALADRMAWGELPVPDAAARDASVAEMLAALGPTDAVPQVVHGDLTGNVLFDDLLAPAIIDFSPYVRPAVWALAIIASDAVIWHGAPLRHAERVVNLPDGPQCLLRAMLFRHLTALLLPGAVPGRSAAERYAALRRMAIDAA